MEINDTQYKEVEVNKMIINGKEQAGNIINAEDTKNKQELNVTVYTAALRNPRKAEGGIINFMNCFKKVLIKNKRS